MSGKHTLGRVARHVDAATTPSAAASRNPPLTRQPGEPGDQLAGYTARFRQALIEFELADRAHGILARPAIDLTRHISKRNQRLLDGTNNVSGLRGLLLARARLRCR